MIFWFLAAILTATVTALIVTPLMVTSKVITMPQQPTPNYRFFGLVLCLLIPVLAVGIYFFNGNPELIP